jgi:penicillin-insensitive murein endopeptidase
MRFGLLVSAGVVALAATAASARAPANGDPPPVSPAAAAPAPAAPVMVPPNIGPVLDPAMTAAAWGKLRVPAPGPARAIGGYSAGCIQGAEQLPLVGVGFRVARPERRRVFGHPLLIGLLRDLGAQLSKLKLPGLTLGDLSQPRGGPAPTGHASHQTGLDVDIWFAPPSHGSSVSMVDSAHSRPTAQFTANIARMVELTALDARVDRIFVNPILKRAMCQSAGHAREWLRKVRPWWGHDDHFHVRLSCPPDSPECTPQPALPAGDGCDALAWWFNPRAQAERAKERQSYSSKVGASPALPEACRALVSLPDSQ